MQEAKHVQAFCDASATQLAPTPELLRGDNVAVMKLLIPQCVAYHAVVIDPPTGNSPGKHVSKARYDTLWTPAQWEEVAEAITKVMHAKGCVIVTPGGQQGATSQRVYRDATVAFTKHGFTQSTLTWYKPGYQGLSAVNCHKPIGDSEPLLIFSLQSTTFYKEIGKTSTLLSVAQHDQYDHHMGIKHWKPRELFVMLYSMFVPPGGSVLDITLNSGISASAAFVCKLSFTGIEVDAGYLQDAFRRLAGALDCTADLHSDANADDCRESTDAGGLTLKRKSGDRRRVVKAAKLRALAEDGGFTDKGRAYFRNKGGALVTGNKRTCVSDAVWHLLSSYSIKVDVDTVRTMMSDDLDQDTKFTKADEYVQHFGLSLQRVTPRFKVKGGPELALLNATGFFVVQLTIAYNKDDKSPDKHCVAYDGLTVRDNYQYSKVKEIDSTDRSSPEDARAVFNSLFKNMQVRIKNVYELSRM